MLRALTLSMLLAAPASAATIVIDFEEEAAGDRGDSFEAAPGVTISSLQGLSVGDFDFGTRVLVVGEEGGELLLTFAVPVVSLSIDFGADSDAVRSGLAILTGSADGVPVAIDAVTANRNMLVDQTLTVTFGSPMSYALFSFPQYGEDEPSSAVVDNIRLTTVPEPGALGLLGLAAAAGLVRLLPRDGAREPLR